MEDKHVNCLLLTEAETEILRNIVEVFIEALDRNNSNFDISGLALTAVCGILNDIEQKLKQNKEVKDDRNKSRRTEGRSN